MSDVSYSSDESISLETVRSKKYSVRLSHDTSSAVPTRRGNRTGWSRNIVPFCLGGENDHDGDGDGLFSLSTTQLASASASSSALEASKPRPRKRRKKNRTRFTHRKLKGNRKGNADFIGQPSSNTLPICTDCLRPLILNAPSSKDMSLLFDPCRLADFESDNDSNSNSSSDCEQFGKKQINPKRKLTVDVGRPWVLGCGHLVCSQCIAAARGRCLEITMDISEKGINDNMSSIFSIPTFSSELNFDDDTNNTSNNINENGNFSENEDGSDFRWEFETDVSQLSGDYICERGSMCYVPVTREDGSVEYTTQLVKQITITTVPSQRKPLTQEIGIQTDPAEEDHMPTDFPTSPENENKNDKQLSKLVETLISQTEREEKEDGKREKPEYKCNNYGPVPLGLKRRYDPHVDHSWTVCPILNCNVNVQDVMYEGDEKPWELYV